MRSIRSRRELLTDLSFQNPRPFREEWRSEVSNEKQIVEALSLIRSTLESIQTELFDIRKEANLRDSISANIGLSVDSLSRIIEILEVEKNGEAKF